MKNKLGDHLSQELKDKLKSMAKPAAAAEKKDDKKPIPKDKGKPSTDTKAKKPFVKKTTGEGKKDVPNQSVKKNSHPKKPTTKGAGSDPAKDHAATGRVPQANHQTKKDVVAAPVKKSTKPHPAKGAVKVYPRGQTPSVQPVDKVGFKADVEVQIIDKSTIIDRKVGLFTPKGPKESQDGFKKEKDKVGQEMKSVKQELAQRAKSTTD